MRLRGRYRLENETLVREVNERIAEVAVRLLVPTDERNLVEFVCECGDLACRGQFEMTLAEYAALRARPGRLALAAAHHGGTNGRVVSRRPSYVVVERG